MSQININFIPPVYGAFLVGGTVRDLLLGEIPADWDLVTVGDAADLARRLAERFEGRVVDLGKPGKKIFRVALKSPPEGLRLSESAGRGKFLIDVAPAAGSTIYEDLAKRDFTVNAMAVSLETRALIDPHDGRGDLHRKQIRMILRENFYADPLRLLRAYRFAATLGFGINPETDRAISDTVSRIHEAAAERVRDEILKLLAAPRAGETLAMMDASGLLTEIFPELAPLKACSQNVFHQFDAFEHTIKAFCFLEKLLQDPAALAPDMVFNPADLPPPARFPLLKLAILLHDIGKPGARSMDADGRIHFYGHERTSADLARHITQRLRFSVHDQAYVDFIIRNHILPLSLFVADRRRPLSARATARFFLKTGAFTKDLLAHTMADLVGKGIPENTRNFVRFIRNLLAVHAASFMPRKSSPPLINGNDLIQIFKLIPSPRFARILAHVEEERLAGTIQTRDEALAAVKKILAAE